MKQETNKDNKTKIEKSTKEDVSQESQDSEDLTPNLRVKSGLNPINNSLSDKPKPKKAYNPIANQNTYNPKSDLKQDYKTDFLDSPRTNSASYSPKIIPFNNVRDYAQISQRNTLPQPTAQNSYTQFQPTSAPYNSNQTPKSLSYSEKPMEYGKPKDYFSKSQLEYKLAG